MKKPVKQQPEIQQPEVQLQQPVQQKPKRKFWFFPDGSVAQGEPDPNNIWDWQDIRK